MMGEEINPWTGVSQSSEEDAVQNPLVDRRRPEEERALRAAEVLAGYVGDELDKAVTFRDLRRLEETLRSLTAAVAPQQSQSVGNISGIIRQQFQAINADSENLVDTFNELFDAATQDIGSLGVVVNGTTSTLSTFLDGQNSSITNLTASINGVRAVHGIRINNNGHISGFSLISDATANGVKSDFIIVDANFRIVDTTGGSARTPFAVYTSPRTVDGAIVPAGVYADNLIATRANIAQLAVDTLRVAGEAITHHSTITLTGSVNGNNNLRFIGSQVVNMSEAGKILVWFTGQHKYFNPDLATGELHTLEMRFQAGGQTSVVVVQERGGTAINDYPYMAWSGNAPSGLNYIDIYWRGSDDIDIEDRVITVFGVKR